ncbi:hypothetical protein GA0115240_138219 [Streptomyces sp. DvalAA-14]|uniref:hypothetical protein n=1 Tax=unclassified Streptomyces TaxID=2593676 RepID=UPI00081AFACB|nr:MULTISPECIES: hypothetical protein [unclassified Streptomyces]MYS22110.1 hypothetical protein [Streptomyces sp. SID4948]SCE08826.1 hypothetical protein GA0115240_138219 [Streptomyces sp. DvalAA-14]
MDDVAPEQARSALDVVERARQEVAEEIGLPRGYWWAMAAGWVVLGTLGDVLPSWAAGMATVAFSVGHTTVASRLLDGRRRTDRLQVSSAVAGHRIPLVVVGMLAGLVGLTVAAAVALDADGAGHAGIWATVLVAAVVGFGGPEILRVLRRWVRA